MQLAVKQSLELLVSVLLVLLTMCYYMLMLLTISVPIYNHPGLEHTCTCKQHCFVKHNCSDECLLEYM